MYLNKTDQAVQELACRQRTLGLKERAVLLLADGRKTETELATLLQVDKSLIARLVHSGHLERLQPRPRATPVASPQPAAGEPALAAADPFEGRRSLATARMYLFDLTERMFARRDPVLADSLRNRLRTARDRASMLAVWHDMLAHVEAVAGAQRADGLSERLAMLLPDEALA
jgi:hypothetical protein